MIVLIRHEIDKGEYLLANQYSAAVHMPWIGPGLAGGDWETITAIIEKEL